jgi:hypothetical protein
MKRLLSIAVAVGLVAALAPAASNVVQSANVVGYNTVTLPQAGAILATVNWEQIDGTTNTLSKCLGSELQDSTSPSTADRVTIWDPGTLTYQTWAMYTDKVFYKANNLAQWNLAIAGDPEIPAGAGFWIEPAGGASGPKDLTLAGQAIGVDTQSVTIVAAPQMIGYTYSADIPLQDMDFSNGTGSVSPATADRVSVWLGSAYQVYAMYTDMVWYKANDLAEWNLAIAATNTISMGEGFWYEPVSSFPWSEAIPYTID